ncbi:hypothetical protein [Teichococcus aestuarii]
MSEEEMARLRGKVHGVMPADDGVPEELLRELRQIAATGRKGH